MTGMGETMMKGGLGDNNGMRGGLVIARVAVGVIIVGAVERMTIIARLFRNIVHEHFLHSLASSPPLLIIVASLLHLLLLPLRALLVHYHHHVLLFLYRMHLHHSFRLLHHRVTCHPLLVSTHRPSLVPSSMPHAPFNKCWWRM